MNIPLLQTEKWQKFQQDLGKKTYFESNNNFQYLAIEEKTPLGTYLYCPYGPVAKDAKSFKRAIDSLATKLPSAIFIRVEPQEKSLQKTLNTIKNLKKSKDINPEYTWVLDLTQEKATIISNFSQGTRTRFNQFAKKGLTIETTKIPSKIKELVKLQQALAKEKHINAFPESYLKSELSQDFATLYLVKYQDPDTSNEQTIVASLFFDDQDTRYYMQSAADSKYKKLPGTVALLTTALFDAKEKGLKYFDFWGIAPENAPINHPWAGFTEFKKSFGGSEKSYCGTYDYVLKPAKYHLYQLLRKINLVVRKLKS